MENEKKKKPSAAAEKTDERIPGQELYEWARSCVSAVLLIVLVFAFIIRMMGVQGPSMRQTLQDGDRLMVLDAPLTGGYRRGDIVVANKASFSEDSIIKRVIAVGGQTVDIDFSAGVVYVDGVAQEEDYINDRTYTAEGMVFPLTVPEGSVFLMGDNRNMSTDSRDPRIGIVDERCLIGRAVFLVYPGPDSITKKRDFGRIGFIPRG